MTTSDNIRFLDLVSLGSAGLGIYNTVLNQRQITNDELLDVLIQEIRRDFQEIKRLLEGDETMIKKIISKGKTDDMEELEEIFEEMLCEIEKTNHEMYEDIKMEMYEMAEGKILTKEMAMDWVKSMKPHHEHWNFETTEEVRNSNASECDPVRFYTAMNMMYNDYHDSISRYYPEMSDEPTIYIELSKGWIKDEDAVEHKDYDYKKYIVK